MPVAFAETNSYSDLTELNPLLLIAPLLVAIVIYSNYMIGGCRRFWDMGE
eukprot:NODE_1715_length_423_cov_0.837838_g1705_i0.p4 GENE.NODE_1715_length_423_cov_0.837838_g1705_i0~~NODE_1715_length_423_cov_0.837838_g1705_i0.p4  ORF type:complete len:50 (+),score=13.06 NODE_1715_length_423_cov_0.837838_g1705_i0:100-249(+)